MSTSDKPSSGQVAGAGEGEPESLRKLFIGGLTVNTTEESLKSYYTTWGEITDVVVMKDGQTKRSRGFGFITYAKASSVDEAMKHRPHTIDGKQVDPKRAVPREKSGQPEAQISVKKLFVSGIKENHTDENLRAYFSTFGTVEGVDIIEDKLGKRRGFAFVTFDDFDSVDKLVLIRSHEIAGHRCDVKKALSREEMRRIQERQFRNQSGSGGGGWAYGYGYPGFGNYDSYGMGYGYAQGGWPGWNPGYGPGQSMGWGNNRGYGNYGYGGGRRMD